MMACTSPGRTVSETSLRTSTGPKLLERACASRITGPASGGDMLIGKLLPKLRQQPRKDPGRIHTVEYALELPPGHQAREEFEVRPEEPRVGQECGRKFRSRRAPYT